MISKERTFFNELQTFKLDDLEYTNIFFEPERKKHGSLFANNSKTSTVPIVIDYGTYCTKAVFNDCLCYFQGWGNTDLPSLVFRTVVSKNKDLKNNDGAVFVGNKLKDFDYTKYHQYFK